jgi:hypothetical protein
VECDVKNYIDKIRMKLQDNLSQSATEYLKTAIDLSMKGKSMKFLGDYRTQPVVGNFAIAIELMLKAFILSKNPALVFNLPLELRVAFISPESVGDDFNLRPSVLQLRSFDKIAALEMSELISTFYILRPDLKQELHPFFDLFSQCRNVSVHASLPSFQTYEVERMAYLALRLFKNIPFIAGDHRPQLSGEVDDILTKLDTQRASRVRKKIADAREVAKNSKEGPTVRPTMGWNSYVTECPVCGSGGLLIGYTDVRGTSEEDITPVFVAESFMCHQCELELSDSQEMHLAGMPVVYFREDDVGLLVEEHGDDYTY